MIQLVIWVVAWAAVLLITHELGHHAAALLTHRHTQPWVIRWYGLGVPTEIGDRRTFWKVAAAGPAVNAVEAVLLYPLAQSNWWFQWPFAIAVAMAVVNLVPLPRTDGRWIWLSLRANS